MTKIKTKIIKIGNSQGIRIPKVILEQVQLGEDVELVVQEDGLIIRAARMPRLGWEEAFAKASKGDEGLLDAEADNLKNTWDDQEWEW